MPNQNLLKKHIGGNVSLLNKNKLDYRQDVKVDTGALDVEWAEHPEKCLFYIEQLAELRKQARLDEEEVKTTRSELILEANEDPVGCCGKEKPNAADIEAYYRNDDGYKAAKETAIKAADAALVAEDMKNLMTYTKTKALEQLVNLHSQSYFIGPTTPRNLNWEMEKRRERKEQAEESKKKTASNLKNKFSVCKRKKI